MSTENASLTDYHTPDTDADSDDETDSQSWTPHTDDSSSARHCQRCGSRVSKRFARVFGDNNDDVHGCLDCKTASEVKRGATKEGCDGSMTDGIQLGGVQ